MSTAEWATVGVAVAGLLATVAAASLQSLLANRRHLAQLEHDRAVADRGDLRAILDGAAEIARQIVWANDEVIRLARRGHAEEIGAAGGEVVRLTRQCVVMSGRLALRLGPEHFVTQAFERMLDVFLAMEAELLEATPTGVRARLGLIRRRSLDRRYHQIADRRSAEFYDAWRAFIDAAGGLAAAQTIADVHTSKSGSSATSTSGVTQPQIGPDRSAGPRVASFP